MTSEIRPFDDWPALVELLRFAFADEFPDDAADAERVIWEPKRSIAVVEGGVPVGHASAFSLQMTVPGTQLPVAGVSMVAVRPTHRRRGLLRELMRRQLTELYETGAEPVAGLTASEPVIYPRFGYGLATDHLRVKIPQTPGVLRKVPGTADVTIRYADVAGALDECTRIHNQVAAGRAGMFSHDERWRKAATIDVPYYREGGTPLRCLMAERSGETTGYAYYRAAKRSENGRRQGSVNIDRVHATDLTSYLALWEFLLDQDLLEFTEYGRLPSDDPLLSLLADPRAALPRIIDGLWVRLVDVPRALAARTYESDVDVVIGVRDEFCPWNAGGWRLVGGPDGASCERTAQEPDVVADVREYGAAYLGRPSLARSGAAGLVEERTPGSLAAVSRAFATTQLPWLDTGF
jgi:predicted acetyltransferase